MKTEKQTERDKENGIINLKDEFNKKTGKILRTGLIRKEIDPVELEKLIEPVRQKITELGENLETMKKTLASAPVSCEAAVLEFLDIQKKAGRWVQAESLRAQIKQRQADYNTLIDDIAEQDALLKEYKEYKK